MLNWLLKRLAAMFTIQNATINVACSCSESKQRQILDALASMRNENVETFTDIENALTEHKTQLETIGTTVDAIQGDVGTLNTKIADLENIIAQGGSPSAALKAVVADIKTLGGNLATKTKTIDDLTPAPPA